MDTIINSSFSKFIIAVLHSEKESSGQMQCMLIDEMSDMWYNKNNDCPVRYYMRNQKTPFELTNQIIDYLMEIEELVGLSAVSSFSANPMPRCTNWIRSIYDFWPSIRIPFSWSR